MYIGQYLNGQASLLAKSSRELIGIPKLGRKSKIYNWCIKSFVFNILPTIYNNKISQMKFLFVL